MAARAIALGVVALLAVTSCGDDDPADAEGPIEVVSVLDDVVYYPACANFPVEIDGTTWYPVPEWGNDDLAELYAEMTALDRQQPTAIQGLAARVAPPGPGDDTGTLVIWADDVARFESDSGLVQWFTDEEQTYDWVC